MEKTLRGSEQRAESVCRELDSRLKENDTHWADGEKVHGLNAQLIFSLCACVSGHNVNRWCSARSSSLSVMDQRHVPRGETIVSHRFLRCACHVSAPAAAPDSMQFRIFPFLFFFFFVVTGWQKKKKKKPLAGFQCSQIYSTCRAVSTTTS